MRTQNIPLCYRKRDPYYASLPGAFINPHWLELPLSRTNFYGPKGVRAIEVRLYVFYKSYPAGTQHRIKTESMLIQCHADSGS